MGGRPPTGPPARKATLHDNSMPKRTFTAHGPVRGDLSEDGRQSMAILRSAAQTVNLVLVALTDGVEVELYADGTLRRRCASCAIRRRASTRIVSPRG